MQPHQSSILVTNQHDKFMSAAIDCAETSVVKGNHPFGAVLVFDSRIVLAAENTVITDHDCTAHAEMNLIRRASGMFSSMQMKGSTLYASTEPCAMCAGAIYWSGIRTVVFGCSAKDLGAVTTGSFVTSCRDVFAHGRENTEVIGGCCEARAKELHARYWSF